MIRPSTPAVGLVPGASVCIVFVSQLLASPVASAAPGDLDPSFGVGGTQVTDFGGTDTASALALKPDGRFVRGGQQALRVDRRRLQRGRFAGSGVRPGRAHVGDLSSASDVALLPDGKLLVLGVSTQPEPGGRHYALRHRRAARYAFGEGGVVLDQITPRAQGRAMAIQPDGRILVAGGTDDGPVIVRYDADGTRDMTFGTGGRTAPVPGESISFTDVALQADGKIVAVGSSAASSSIVLALQRRWRARRIVCEWGLAMLDAGSAVVANAVVIQSDGGILVAGRGGGPSAIATGFLVARFLSDGSPDPSFGSAGWQLTNFPTMSPDGDD